MTAVLGIVAAAALALGALLALRAAGARRAPADGVPADGADAARLGLLLGRLVAVAAVSVPALWLALRAEVPQWPGLVCVHGVLRLGASSDGPAAWLPWLLAAAFAAKAVTACAAGAAVALRRLDAGLRDAALTRRAAAWMTLAGAAAAADGAATLGWVLVPREGPRVASGCCTAVLFAAADSGPVASAGGVWTAAFLACGAAAAFALWLGSRTPRLRRARSAWWIVAVAASFAAAGSGSAFAATSLAPARLRLPLHECAFCLLDRAPENWLGVAALLAAPACAVWAWTSARAADRGAGGSGDAQCSRLLGVAAFAALAALVLGASGRWLA